MKIVAIETGAAQWGIACAACDPATGKARPAAVFSSAAPRELSQQLFIRLQSTLDEAGWSKDDVDGLAVGLGPGSWTGLRIGLSAAKTLAQARNWKLAGVPSFDALAQAVWRDVGQENATLLEICAPCRPGEIYAKLYEASEDYLAVVQNEWIGSPELVAATLSTQALARGIDIPVFLSGNAAAAIEEVMVSQGQEYSLASPPFEDVLLELAIAGSASLDREDGDDPMKLQPLYLAPSNAERNLLNR